MKSEKRKVAKAEPQTQAQAQAQAQTQAIVEQAEHVEIDGIYEKHILEAVEGFSGMLGEVDMTKVEKVEDFSGIVPCVTVRTKDKDIRITDPRYVSAITRMRNADKAAKGIDAVLMGNVVQMKKDGFVDKYHLKKAEDIFKFIGVEVSTQKAQKLVKVGEAFVTMKDGVPVLDHRLPNLPLFTLDYLTSFVEDNEDGEKDYTKLGEFIAKYGIGDHSTQKEVKDAVKQYNIDNGLVDKKSEDEDDTETQTQTDGEKAQAKSRGDKLAKAVEGVEALRVYFLCYDEAIMDEGTTLEAYKVIVDSLKAIEDAVEVEKAHRENDLNSNNSKDAEKWTK